MFGDQVGLALFSGLVGAYFLGSMAFAAYVMKWFGSMRDDVRRVESPLDGLASVGETLRRSGAETLGTPHRPAEGGGPDHDA